jgi:hypothetical protein
MRGRTAFFWGGAAVGAIWGASVGWWLRGPDTGLSATGPPPPSGAPSTSAGIGRSLPAAFRAPVAHPVPPPPGPLEAALRSVAAYTGDGVVRCEVGDRVPEGPVTGVGRGRVDDQGVLFGAVGAPEGQARILLPDDPPGAAPLVVVQWRAAWPGAVGQCDVLAPERVAVTGTVVGPGGEPLLPEARAAAQVGNSVEGGAPLGPDGRFLVACWRGAPCPISVRAAPRAPWGPFTVVVPDRPTSGVTLALMPPGPAQTVRDWVEERIAEDAWIEATPDPLDLALADPELPAEARAWVEGWRDEDLGLRDLHQDLRAQLDSVRTY